MSEREIPPGIVWDVAEAMYAADPSNKGAYAVDFMQLPFHDRHRYVDMATAALDALKPRRVALDLWRAGEA